MRKSSMPRNTKCMVIRDGEEGAFLFVRGFLIGPRQERVLELLAAGHSTAHIAEKMAISVKTVEGYYAVLREKLEVDSLRHLVLIAAQLHPSKSRGVVKPVAQASAAYSSAPHGSTPVDQELL